MRYLFVLLIIVVESINAFVFPSASALLSTSSSSSNTRCYNFLKDAFNNAFSNDRDLSADIRKGQYDDIFTGEEYVDTSANNAAEEGLTDVQKKWRQTQLLDNNNNINNINSDMIAGTSSTLGIYLAGVSERDPSSDLYGSRVNISSRDKETGLSLPSTPSVYVQVDFLDDGICKVSESSFTTGNTNGKWKLFDNDKVLRFSIDTLGYTRTVETKGSISKVFWTDEEEKTTQTSTTYFIPPGPVYGDIQIIPGRKIRTFDLGKEGVLRLEKSSGLFGAASKMVPCGKFVATRNDNNDE